MMNNLRKHIRRLVPLGVILRRTRNPLMQMRQDWKDAGGRLEWDTHSLFSRIYSVEGFGCTGSSAVVDVMREHDGVCVAGGMAYWGSLTSPDASLGEIDIVRCTGGLLQLAQCFDERLPHSPFWNDALIKHFIENVYYSTIFQKVEPIRPCIYKFLDEILDTELRQLDGHIFNPAMGKLEDSSDIYFLRPLSLEQYHCLCRDFLHTLLNRLHRPGCDILVLDQLFADCGHDTDNFRKFLPELERIRIYRDPRDVYCLVVDRNHTFIPHDTVSDYIRWAQSVYRGFTPGDGAGCLDIRFESLVNESETEIARLHRFMNLGADSHARPRQCFDPAISVKGTGIWRHRSDISDIDFRLIHDALPQICYDNE